MALKIKLLTYLNTNNARILRTEIFLFIVGDSAYPLDRWLMKSFPHNSIPTNKQKTFNYLIFRACTKTENTFGCLKARWRKLMKQNEY